MHPLDESGLAGAEHLDPDYVAGYDRKARVDPAEDLAALELGRDDVLIDFGAGTGTFAVAAAPSCARVIAVDASPAMVDAMRAKVAQHGLTNVDCVQAGFLGYEHRGAPVDVVYTRNALHHLPDFWKAIALRRMADVLKPGGVLRFRDLVYSFELDEAQARMDEWLETAAAHPEEGWTRAELESHIRDEHSTFSWLLEPMLERAGFVIESAEYADGGVYAAYTCRKPG